MGPVSAYSGQQSVSPLTKQLRGQERPDVALKNSETLKERTTSNQSGATPVASTKSSFLIPQFDNTNRDLKPEPVLAKLSARIGS